jgi:hypothetical protein
VSAEEFHLGGFAAPLDSFESYEAGHRQLSGKIV